MAIMNDTSLEDVTKPKSRYLEGFKTWAEDKASSALNSISNIEETASSAVEAIEWAASSVIDYAKDIKKELPTVWWAYDTLYNVWAWIAKWSFKDFDLFWNKTLNKPLVTDVPEFTSEDRRLWKELNSIHWFDMAMDYWSALIDTTKQLTVWTELKWKLLNWVNENEFNEKISILNKTNQDLKNKISEIESQEKYQVLNNFNNNVVNEYLKLNNITEITDIEDFENFRQSYLTKLNWIKQKNIIDQYTELNNEVSEYSKQIMNNELEIQDYIANNVQWWEEEYKKILDENNKKLKDNKTISLIWEIYNNANEKVTEDIQSLWIEKISDFSWFNDLKQSVVDDLAADKQYELSVLWMNDLPDNELYAKKIREVNKVSYDFNLSMVKNLIEAKNNPENKWLSEVDLRNKVLNQTWNELPQYKKDLFSEKERLITSISQKKEWSQFNERISKWELWASIKSWLDLASYAWVTIQKIFDKAFDYTNEWVPHYVKQETRNLIYSDEWMGKKFISSLTYNPDAILSSIASIYAMNWPAKWIEWALKWAEKVITKIPWLNIWFGKWTLQFVWKWVREITAWQIYWAATDPIIDNLLVEAPTSGIESFNQLTSVLFDVTPLAVGQWYKTWTWFWKTTMNSIAYNYLIWKDEKLAVNDFIKWMKEKTWVTLTWWQAKETLDNLVKPLYYSLYNPEEVKNIFNNKWELYKFITENVSNMDKEWLTQLLTEKWLWLSRNLENVTWIKDEDILNLSKAFDKKLSTEWVQKQFADSMFNKITDVYKEILEPWKWINWIQIDSKFKEDPEYLELKWKVNWLINQLKIVDNKKEFNELLWNINSLIKEWQVKFASNTKVRDYVDATDINTWNEVRVYLDELSEDSNFLDLIKTWTIEFKNWKELKKFKVKDSKISEVQIQFDLHINKNKNKINNFITDNNLSEVDESEIIKHMKTLLFWREWKNKDVTVVNFVKWMELDKAKEVMNNFATLTADVFGSFLWKDEYWFPIIKETPIYINDVVDTNKETMVASWVDIAKYMSEDNSYINISYWFYKRWEELQNWMYLYMWKKVQFNDIIKDSISWVNEKWDIYIDKLINEHNRAKKIILSYWFKDWMFDIKKWLEKLNIISSVWNIRVADLFEWWKVSKDKLRNYIINQTKLKDAEIIDFIYDLFKNTWEWYSISLEPMINSIAYNYASNKWLIDELIKRSWDNQSFSEIFSSILLSNDVLKDMSDILLSSSKVESKYKTISNNILELIENNWERYKWNLSIYKTQLENRKKELNSFIKENNSLLSTNKNATDNIKMWIINRKALLEDEVINIDKRIKTINSELTKRKNPNTDVMLSSYMQDSLRGKVNSFSKIINIKNEEVLKRINELEESIIWLEKTWELKIKTIKEIIKLSDDERKVVSEFLSKVKSWASDDELLLLIDWMTNESLKWLAINIRQLSNMNFWNKKIVFKEDLFKEFDAQTSWRFLLDYEEAIKINPLSKFLNWFLNRNSVNEDWLFTKNILDYFWKIDWKDFSWLDSFDLYKNSDSFKWFIDSLTVSKVIKTKDWKEISLYNLNWKLVWYNEIESNYKKVLRDLTNSIKIQAVKDWEEININDELIDSILEDAAIRNRFVAISRLKDYNKLMNSNWVNKTKQRILDFKKVKPSKYSKKFNSIKETSYQEQILQIDNMINWWMDIWLIKKVDFWLFWYVKEWEERAINISTTIQSINESNYKKIKQILNWRKIDQLNNEEKKNVLALYVNINRRPWEALDRFSKIFNKWEKYWYVFQVYDKEKNIHKDVNQTLDNSLLIEQSWLKDYYDEWYYFAATFWDKDSYYQLYRAPEELINHFWLTSRDEINKISWDIYKAHYAYSNWYISKDVPYNTFNDLILRLKELTIPEAKKLLKQLDIYLLDEKTIKKREAFNMSNYSLAWNDKTKIDWYVVDVQVKTDVPNIEWLSNEEIILKIKEYISTNWKYSTVFQNILDASDDIRKQIVGINEVFYKDLTDWTAWSTIDIGSKLLSYMWFGSYEYVLKNIIWKWKIREIKSHVFWDIDLNWKKVRYGWKHLVNIPNEIKIRNKDVVNWKEISTDGEPLEMTYITGIESAKLKEPVRFDLTDEDPKFLVIDWVEYKVKWVIEWMDMSFYKNASTTLLEDHTDMTIWAAIQSTLSADAANKTVELQKLMIDNAYEKLLMKIENPNLELDAWSDIDKAINKIVNKYSIWMWSSSVLWNKVNQFITEVNNIIDKAKDEWQSVFIRQSSLDIAPNEVIMSKNSPLVKQVLRETTERMYPDKKLKELTDDEKIQVLWNLYVVWYRFPVPSKYNMWTYRVLIWEDLAEKNPNLFWEFGNMWEKQVVTHPLSTYLKLQWDNDWDHIFFISMLWKWWDVISKDILWKNNSVNLFNDIKLENLTESDLTKTWLNDKFNNEFIITDQVDKDKKDVWDISLADLRIAAIDGKARIWMVSATGRTIKILSQINSQLKNNPELWNLKLIKDVKTDKWTSELQSITFNELVSELKWIKTNKEFFSYYDSLLQLTIDFWGWNQTKFDELWFVELMTKLINPELSKDRVISMKKYAQDIIDGKKIEDIADEDIWTLIKVFEYMDTFITPMSTRYSSKLSVLDIEQLIRQENKSKSNRLYKPSDWDDISVALEKYYPLIWTKRDIYNYIKDTFWDILSTLNKTDDFDFLLNNILSWNTKFHNKWKKIISKHSDFWFIPKEATNDFNKEANKEYYLEELFNETLDYLDNITWEEEIIARRFLETIEDIYKTSDKKEKEILRKWLFTTENLLELNKYPEAKILSILKAYFSWENKIVNYLTNDEKLDYLLKTDTSLRLKTQRIYEDAKSNEILNKLWITLWNEYTVASKEKYKDFLEKNISDLEDIIDKTEVNTPDDDLYIDSVKSKINEIKDEINLLKSQTVEDIKESVKEVPNLEYEDVTIELPTIKQELLPLDRELSEELLFNYGWTIQKTANVIRIKTSTQAFKYIPDLLEVYENIRSLLNTNKKISDATAAHIYNFADYWFLPNKKWIWYILKNANIDKYEQVWREIQYAMLRYDNWLYTAKPIDEALLSMKSFMKTPEMEEVLKSQDFIDAVTKYSKDVIEPIAETLTRIDEVTWYRIFNKYRWEKKYSIITDVLEWHKSDAQLALKVFWINSKKEFESLLKKRWVNISWTIKTLINALFTPPSSTIDKVIWFFKSVHYSMTYWLWSTFLTQNWLMSGIAQLFPNYAEIKAYYRANIDNMADAYKAMETFGLLNAENVKMFGTSIDKDLTDWSTMNWLITRIFDSAWLKNVKWNEAASLLHMVITNPLAVGDLPVEQIRKLVAINQAMDTYWIKSFADLNKKVILHWNQFLWRFRARVNANFAESWGWVVSSSRIYRDTIFSQLDNYFDNVIFRMFTQTMWYLMWWSYYKASTLIEKQWALLTAVKDFNNWNYSSAKAHFDDWMAFNNAMFRQLTYTAWLYLKLQKYEKDNNERVSIWEFQKAFNNSIVSLEIMLWRYKDWLEAADMQGATADEKATYTVFNMLKNWLRLWKQVEFVPTMFNHYQMQQLEWKWNILESFQYATQVHYTWYMKFQWIQELSDAYNSLISKWTTWYLLVGWTTPEEELFNNVITWNIFNSYQEKWFIWALLNHINVFKNTWWNAWFNLTWEMAKEFRETLTSDKNIKRLISWGQLWTSENDYNLSLVIWDKGLLLSKTQWDNTTNLYYKIKNYLYWLSGPESSVDSKYHSKYQDILTVNIMTALKQEWLTLEEWSWLRWNSSDFLNILSTLESKYNISTPVALSLYIDNQRSNMASALSKQLWRKLTPADYKTIERDVILDNQDLLNLNSDFVFQVIDSHASTYYSDIFDKYEEKFRDAWFAIKDAVDYVNKSYLIWQVVSKDTSVTKLLSRYSLALKSLPDNESSISLVNWFLQWLQDLPHLSEKEKLANAAAAIMWLNKNTLWLLSDDEEFKKLTSDSRKLISNWMFKISKESIDFDSNYWLNKFNWLSWTWTKPYNRLIQPKYKSEWFWWARPNFSKQFEPIRKMMSNTIPYIEKDYNWYLQKNNPYTKESFVNPLKFPIMKKYFAIKIEQLFRGYESKWVIKNKAQRKIEDNNRKTLRLKKSKKIKLPKQSVSPRRRVLKHSKWLNPNLELWTQINN